MGFLATSIRPNNLTLKLNVPSNVFILPPTVYHFTFIDFMEMEMEREILVNSVIKSMKRKANVEFKLDPKIKSNIRAQIAVLNSSFSSTRADREIVNRSVSILSDLSENGMNTSFDLFSIYYFIF